MTGPHGALDTGRQVILASGEQAEEYLHGQISQDVAGLEVGQWAPSLLLAPNGRLEAVLGVQRLGPQDFALDVDDEVAELVKTSLERFRLRMEVEFSAPGWRVVAVRGADAPPPGAEHGRRAFGSSGTDYLVRGEGSRSEDYEPWRISAGWPRTGVDLDEGTLAHETGMVDMAVDFGKGCYRGQELVERVESRSGGRRLLVQLTGLEAVPESGDPVVSAAGEEIGSVTSAAPDPVRGGVAALAVVNARADLSGIFSAGSASSGRVYRLGSAPQGAV